MSTTSREPRERTETGETRPLLPRLANRRWVPPFLLALVAAGLATLLVARGADALGLAVSLTLLSMAWYSLKAQGDRARLYAALRREKQWLELLHEVSLELGASLDLDEVLRRTLDRVSAAVGATRGSLLLLDSESNQLILVGTVSQQGKGIKRSGLSRLAVGTGLAGWVAANRRGAVVPDVWEDQRWRRFEVEPSEGRPPTGTPSEEADCAGDVRSAISVPLVSEGVLLGVATLTHPKVAYFGSDHQRLLTAIANPVAAAINNAKLYEAMTAEKRKADLERSRLNAIIDHLPLGLAMVDRSLRVVIANPAYSSMLGLAQALEPGCPLLEAISPAVLTRAEDAGPLLAFLADCERHLDRVITSVLTLRAPIRHLRLLAAPVRSQQGQIVGRALIVHDVTTEREIDRMKSEFVANVSHELRSPLASIKAYSEVLLGSQGSDDPALRLQFLQVINQEADHLAGLIDNVLDLSKMETGQATPVITSVDLAEVVRESVLILGIQAEARGIAIETLIAPQVERVEADAQMMRTLVKNLVGNAVKHNRDGGRVWVALHSDDQMATLEVRDTGVGIPTEALPHLFEKFYQVQPPSDGGVKGSGLGLALVAQILERHGGRVEVKSELGQGSVFRVTLPLKWSGSREAAPRQVIA